jgi:hypothetical protein
MIITAEEWLQAVCVCAFKVHIGILSVSEVCSNHHVDIKDYLKNSSTKIQESSLLNVEEMKESHLKSM